MPSQLIPHYTLYIGKVNTVSPPFFLPSQTFADYHQDRKAGGLWKDNPPLYHAPCQERNQILPKSLPHNELRRFGPLPPP